MKSTLTASVIGAIILFFWQFLSQAALDLHKMEHQYAPNQDTIVSFLSSQLKEGKYKMPLPKPGCTMEEAQQFMKESVGKPSIMLDYQIVQSGSMGMSMVRGFLTNIIILFLFITLLNKMAALNFKTVVVSSIIVGLIGFLNHSYTNYIWYHAPGIWLDLLDAVAGWGLVGLYLGKAKSKSPENAK
jgi:hypothetical protein